MFNLITIKFFWQKIKLSVGLVKNYSTIRFFILFVLLLIVYRSAFSIPPRSDFWHMFYFFHHLDQFPGAVKWLHVVNYDFFEQMRFQPIPPLLFYLYHLVFGSYFIQFNNIMNFVFYFLSLSLAYKFIINFCKDRTLVFIFIALLSLLFSHADMLFWSYHSYLFLGFSIFMSGLLKYIDFLKNGNMALLPYVTITMFLAMLFYEPFFFWPLVIVIMASLNSYKNGQKYPGVKIVKLNTILLIVLYSLYFIVYLLTRSLKTYQYQSHGLYEFLNIFNILKGIFAALTNIIYNNILLNLVPILAFPLNIRENVDLGGRGIYFIESAPAAVFIAGAILTVLFALLVAYFIKRKYFEELKIIALLTFLPCTYVFIIVLGRLITNDVSYTFKQFRYQYVPNLFMVLLVIFMLDRFGKNLYGKVVKVFMITVIVISNILCISKLEYLYTYQFFGLKTMLSSVREGIKQKKIDATHKLYIDPELPEYLPVLCWNIEIGERFIPAGNYQWAFSAQEINYFTDNLKDASWLIDKKDFGILVNTPENAAKKVDKVDSSGPIEGLTYFYVNKDRLYMETAWVYKARNQYPEAEKMFYKAIDYNPSNSQIYRELADIYFLERKDAKAEEALRKASELDSKNN